MSVLNVRTDLQSTQSAARTYADLAAAMPINVMVVLGPGSALELRRELGSWEAVASWAADLVVRLGRPVLVNIPERRGSRTIAIAPGWSRDRLAGYVAGRHAELEEAFGAAERVA